MPITGVGLTTADFANTLRDLPACLDRFEKLGVDSVELSMGAFDVVAGARVIPHRLEELKRICADRPFRYTLHGPINSTFTDRRHLKLQRDVCKAAMDVSWAVGATAQVHHAGMTPADDHAEREALWALEREVLTELAPHAAACNVMLCVENIFDDGAEVNVTPSELAAQVSAVAHPNIRATVDFSHAAINAGQRGFDLMSDLAALAPVAGHLHVHDSFGIPRTFEPYTYGEGVNFGLGDLHMPPGWGALDWHAIARLPFTHDVVANLELSTRYDEELESSIALCHEMIAISKEAML